VSGMLSDQRIAKAIVDTLTTPDEQGKGKIHRDANLTDAVYAIALAIDGLSGAIERLSAKPAREVARLQRR
jgi:hypothetical protein